MYQIYTASGRIRGCGCFELGYKMLQLQEEVVVKTGINCLCISGGQVR